MILLGWTRALLALLAAVACFTWAAASDSAHAQVQIAVIGDSNVYGKGLSPSQN